jgi:hypothetical protein
MGSGYRHYAGLKGTKELHVGSDSSVYEYQTINAAVAAAQNNDVIVLAPGTHTLVEKVTINKPLSIIGMGHPKVTCSAAVTADMFAIELVAQSAASKVYFENIEFHHGTDNVDVFDINNTAVAQTLTVAFKDCDIKSFDAASTGNAIDMNQATATQICHLAITGNRSHQVDCVNIAVNHASNTYIFDGIYMTEVGNASAIITDATAKAAIIRLYNVAFKTALKGTTGGNAAQTIVAMNCLTESAGAKVVTGDLAGSHTETLIAP